MAMNMSVASSSIMQQHDPNDDPFAALSQETEQNVPTLVSPIEFGMGLKNVKAAATSPGSDEEPTEATQDETEHDDAEELGDKATAATDETKKEGDTSTSAE